MPNLAQTLAGGRAEPPCSIKTASGEGVKLRMRTALAPAEGCVLTPGWGSCAMPGFSLWSGRLHLSVSTKIVDRLLLFRKASVFSQLSFSRATSTLEFPDLADDICFSKYENILEDIDDTHLFNNALTALHYNLQSQLHSRLYFTL